MLLQRMESLAFSRTRRGRGWHPDRVRGFSLLEVSVALAIVVILVGMMTPLVLKTLNQQRETRARAELKTLFEALFGARDRRVANLRADIGFDPASASGTVYLNDLSILMGKGGATGWSGSAPYAPNASAYSGVRDYALDATYGGLFWGYNGPYWTGSTLPNGAYPAMPVDPWGNEYRLKLVKNASPSTTTWQVYSFGPDGQNDLGADDDLVYPASPAYALSYTSIVNLNTTLPGSRSGSITLYQRNATGTVPSALAGYISGSVQASTYSFSSVSTLQQLVYNPAAGGVVIKITITSPSATYWYALDLLPGEIRDFSVSIP